MKREEFNENSLKWHNVNLFIREFNRTQNPLFLWQAFSLCREYELPIPEDIIDWLDRTSGRLRGISHKSIQGPNKPIRAIKFAMGFEAQAARQFEEFEEFLANYSMAVETDVLIKLKDEETNLSRYNQGEAISEQARRIELKDSAGETSVSDISISRNYKKYKAPKK